MRSYLREFEMAFAGAAGAYASMHNWTAAGACFALTIVLSIIVTIRGRHSVGT